MTHTSPSRFALSLGLALVLALLLPTVGAAQTEVHRTVALDADGNVRINNIAGSVAVTGWDRKEVEISGTLGRNVEELAVDGDGRQVHIEVELPRRSRGDSDAHLEIKVPRGASVSIETVSADITGLDLDGRFEAESVSGSIDLEGNVRQAEVETVSGRIQVEAATEELSAESVSGNIELTGLRGSVEAETVSGSLILREASAIRHLELETVSGRIDFLGDFAPGAEIEISSHSGPILLELPSSLSARFKIETFSGGIDNEFGPQAERVDRYSPEKVLKFTAGGGDAEVSIETFSGRVELRRR